MLWLVQVSAQKPFEVRGVLPWHNFLTGPSAWNEEDYRKYLDECCAAGINFIGFHNYTGGTERYATYVEPMIKISYRGVVPQAMLDNSLTARWGYLPMKVSDFAFGSACVFPPTSGVDAFGSDASTNARTPEEHYESTQALMRRVMGMAHERDMQMAMGFEFGVLPPEYYSLSSVPDNFYWRCDGGMVPNPASATARDLHFAAIDDILESYPGIDWIWLWLNEHSFMSVDAEAALKDGAFAVVYDKNKKHFCECRSRDERFAGVWSLEYIAMTYEYLRSKGSDAGLIIGGWGGGNQLPQLLKGLDRALPKDIVFSCLNPSLGLQSQPDFMAEIARNRRVWAMPWLEGDHQMWHFQPRINLMCEHVGLAVRQNLDGVVAVHWRTEETRFNFRAFADSAAGESMQCGVESLYEKYLCEEIGKSAAMELAPILTDMDIKQTHGSVFSPEFYAFNPYCGRLDKANRELREDLVTRLDRLAAETSGERQDALIRMRNMFRFELLLDTVSEAMIPAYEIWKAPSKYTIEECRAAYAALDSAPVEEMFETYTARVNSRGELGVLSSLNQRVWSMYIGLKEYLNR